MSAGERTPPGWPRPIRGGYPVPWVSPASSLGETIPERREEVLDGLLCQVCGEGHDPDGTAYLLVGDPASVEDGDPTGRSVRLMDDALMHERCARLAVARCPELRRLRGGHLAVFRGPVDAVVAVTLDDEDLRGDEAADCLVADGDRLERVGLAELLRGIA